MAALHYTTRALIDAFEGPLFPCGEYSIVEVARIIRAHKIVEEDHINHGALVCALRKTSMWKWNGKNTTASRYVKVVRIVEPEPTPVEPWAETVSVVEISQLYRIEAKLDKFLAEWHACVG